MTAPHHDSAAWLEVWYRPERRCHVGNGAKGYRTAPAGWWVRRTCPCHDGKLVSIRFDTEAQAERCLRVLDEDCRIRNGAAA